MIVAAFERIRAWADTKRKKAALVVIAFVTLSAMVGCWHTVKPLPPDLCFSGKPVAVPDHHLRLLTDVTWEDRGGTIRREQAIFDEIFRLIDDARRLLVLDLFLFNDHLGLESDACRRLSSELTDHLVAARRRAPEMPIVLVTDPINDVYGGDPSPQLASLREAGVQVVITDLDRLRDSNPLYSSLWRTALQWWGNSASGGWLPNPLNPAGRAVTVRTWLRLANFKANHRKLVLADRGDAWVSIVTSANPHDGSSAHSNVAVEVESAGFAHQVYRAEMEVVRLSDGAPPFSELPDLGRPDPGGDHTIAYLTECAIRDQAITLINRAGSGDSIDLAIFYLSHRRIIDALVAAAERGAWVRVVLDPNRDAFGHKKPGVPNRQSAAALIRDSGGAVAVRWYATHGEQFHTKLLVVRRRGWTDAILGSANFTRRNLDGYNLEASAWVGAPQGSVFDRHLKLYMDRIWTNSDGLHTVPYAAYEDPSTLRRLAAWLQERTGVGTF